MLESVLRSGLQVIKYHHCDICPTAAKVMRHRLNELGARYPELLSSDATDGAFDTLPQDVKLISTPELSAIVRDLVDTGATLFVGAGYSCKDLSSAGGAPKGLRGSRSSLFYPAVEIVTILQQKLPDKQAIIHEWVTLWRT